MNLTGKKSVFNIMCSAIRYDEVIEFENQKIDNAEL